MTAGRGWMRLPPGCGNMIRRYPGNRHVLRTQTQLPRPAPRTARGFVYLAGSSNDIRNRLSARMNHYMPSALLDSQLPCLEPPRGRTGLTIGVAARPAEIAAEIIRHWTSPRTVLIRVGRIGSRLLVGPPLDDGDQLELRDRHLRGELPLRNRAQDHLRDHRAKQLHSVRSFGPHHRLVFPLNGILDLEDVPDHEWNPLQNMVVIYALFPNIVLSATIANGELFRVYPGDVPSRSITVHQNSPLWTCRRSPSPRAHRRYSSTPTAPSATRTMRWSRATVQPRVRRERAAGVRPQQPGLRHRHETWEDAISRGVPR